VVTAQAISCSDIFLAVLNIQTVSPAFKLGGRSNMAAKITARVVRQVYAAKFILRCGIKNKRIKGRP
jgi:hypothetical protein